MGFLLATCPLEGVRAGEKAVEYANKANDLAKGQDWTCLDTLAAAYAETEDFDSAIKWANKALQCAPRKAKNSFANASHCIKGTNLTA